MPRLVSASEDQTIKLWNIESGECVGTLSGHTKAVWALEVISAEQLARYTRNRQQKFQHSHYFSFLNYKYILKSFL